MSKMEELKSFSLWVAWKDRDSLKNISFPGVYAIAVSSANISGEPFSLRKEIKYFGMTNFTGGLKTRLRAFDRTIDNKTGHGGAMRFSLKYPKYEPLVRKLYVSVLPVKFPPKSDLPNLLLTMGHVAELEFICLAAYAEVFKRLPAFNDKKNSPKRQQTI